MKKFSTFLFESEQIRTFDMVLENLAQARKNFLLKGLIEEKNI